MSYYEGIDYWVRYVEFPNMASESVVASHGDGTFTIYVNTLFSLERQLDRLAHELRHLEREHFYRDELNIGQMERQADGAACGSAVQSRTLPGPPPRFSVFRSNALPPDASFAFYAPDASLRPYFQKGALVLCDGRRLRPGDVGLFHYRGATLCRRYHKDLFGVTYLFSLDRSCSREDIVIPACREADLLCYGRVRMKNRP